MILVVLPVLLQSIPADAGEVQLRNIRQLTFGGQNAEAYFSRSGRQLVFQRTGKRPCSPRCADWIERP